MSGWHQKIIIEFLRDRDGDVCGICGLIVEENVASIDHIVPVSQGGSHKMGNLRLAHRRCNVSHFRKHFKSKRNPPTEEAKAHRLEAIRRPEVREKCRQKAFRFWQRVRTGEIPPPRRHKRTPEEATRIALKIWETRRRNGNCK